ncbi:MAG: putative glycoside hydrolase, partial [Vallitaleaceae bacterium]|nr:putative glycoside hydrolase [Vallitaleaceae bacterium]
SCSHIKAIVQDFYPNKGQFLIEESIELIVEYNDIYLLSDLRFIINIYNMEQLVVESEYESSLYENNQKGKLTLPSMPVGGYGAKLIVSEGDTIIQTISTAYDVARSHKALVRYGFLSDFAETDESDEADVISMKKLHINMVQFYDWMYRHESLVSDDDYYVDLMGKSMSRKAVISKIDLCHQHGMSTMAYGAVYAASKEFYDQHPTWGLNDSSGKPITFIDIFYIMNVAESSPWHQYIIDEYKKTIYQLGFDGIHMDTYGFPKKGYDNDIKSVEVIEMDQAFPVLINHTKEQLSKINENVTIIFNNVGNWPVYATAPTNQDMIYVEVWEPYNTYEHIQRIIAEARSFTDKPIIISAYLKPFMTDEHQKAGYSLKLMTACVVANGASHLIMGENQSILTQGYYVDYYPLEDDLFSEIRKYYDFMVRYSALFYNQNLRDVSMTHAYGDNLEYVFKGAPCSPSGEADKIWTIIREDANMKLLSLINLRGNDNDWNVAKKEPNNIRKLIIEIQLEKEVDQVWVTSPRLQSLKSIPYQVVDGDRGRLLTLTLNELDIWTVLVIKLKEGVRIC